MIYVIGKCDECPFCVVHEEYKTCNVATPKFRKMELAVERPMWCALRREQVIVRERAES